MFAARSGSSVHLFVGTPGNGQRHQNRVPIDSMGMAGILEMDDR